MSAERILQILDGVRRLPEPVYQQQRPQLAGFLGQMLARVAAPGVSGVPSGRPPALAAGDRKGLWLDLGPAGEIRGLWDGADALSAASRHGGFALAAGGKEVAILAPVRREGETIVQSVTGPQGVLSAAYRQDGQGLAIRVMTRPTSGGAGVAGPLLLRIPLRAAGWRWEAGPASEVIALAGTYSSGPGEEGKPVQVVLRAPDRALKVTVPPGCSVAFEPTENRLVVRLPVPGGEGLQEVRVSRAPAG
jgi:hypothetical protein